MIANKKCTFVKFTSTDVFAMLYYQRVWYREKNFSEGKKENKWEEEMENKEKEMEK